ncbi:LacI family DNA-binding transcriptional regulator [Pseudoduganella lutea]|uniref:LacI family DNA-binding transcriptional regulator n=1 Tax=Pseudoduganella lutea TaxID=321985 RepID=A0A4P6L3G9_9BURK|nr:LacI family DNA-binding transcriptional regulator [Pseudoduganella lutea]QBE66051.1 LacI family DNA-binding transcriptional regulator [Pseudoduganella lutea]
MTKKDDKQNLPPVQVPAPAPARRLTIKDVALAAGVSLTTVSHALNDRGYVDPDTRARVKRVATELGYRPNLRAQRLRTGKANSIALLSSMPFAVAGGSSRLGFMMEVAAVAAEAAMQRGQALILVPNLEGSKQLIDELDIDGALVVEPVADDPQIRRLRERGVAVVSIGRVVDETLPIPQVDLQSAVAGELLLEHLRTQGARHIALLVGSQNRHSYQEMERVYTAFIRRHRLPKMVAKADEYGGEEAGRAACHELLADFPAIDAICVPVDAFASGAITALNEMGRAVPGDVMVATRYDGLRARNAVPPLTAVNLHLEQVSALAVELLFQHINGDNGQRTVCGPTPDLVPRRSSRA